MTPYERAGNDPAFLDRFVRAYRGANEPLDALWWQEHPEETAPSGAPAPALVLADLRRAMYVSGADQAAAERYRRLKSELAEEREAVLAALEAADARAASARSASAGAALSDAVDAAAPARVTPEEPTVPGRSRRSLLLGLAAVVAAFGAGLLIAPALGPTSAPQPPPTPSPADSAPFISGASGSGSSLGIFGEPQRDIDRPAIDAGARLLPQTFRRLSSVPTRGVDLFAAEDSAGDVCLVAISVDARLAAACAPITGFRSAPLRLAFRAYVYSDATTPTGKQVELVATWGFLGRFTLDEAPVAGD